MTARSQRIARAFVLLTALAAGSALAQTTFRVQLLGAPASITCSTTQVNSTPGMTASWILPASAKIQTTITAGGSVVQQTVGSLPSGTGSIGLDGAINFPNPIAMPYTVVFAFTPLVSGGLTSAATFDCVGGAAANFRILNAPSFTLTSLSGSLENPQVGSPQSGVGLISGWACAVNSVQVAFDDGAKIPVPYGSPRADTATVCGAQTNSGFGLLFNYNTLGPGVHMATLYVNGNVTIGSAPFVVSTAGVEFLTGAQGTINIGNFPTTGKATSLIWQQATQNFAIFSTAMTPAATTGTYQGAFVGTATGCGGSQPTTPISITNVQFAITQTGDNVSVGMTMPGMTPSSCTLNGVFKYNVGGSQHIVQNGNYTCNDGTTGNWNSRGFAFSGSGFSGQSSLTAGNGCSSEVRIAGARNN